MKLLIKFARTLTLDNGAEAHYAVDYLRERGILRSEAPLCPRQTCRRQMTQAIYRFLTLNAI